MAGRPAGESRELGIAARGSAVFQGGIVVNTALQLAFMVLLTHNLSARDVGALLEAVAIFTIVSATCELGADTGLLRFVPAVLAQRPGDTRRLVLAAIWPPVAASLATAGVLIVFARFVADTFVKQADQGTAAALLRILAAGLPAATATVLLLAATRAWTTRHWVVVYNLVVPVLRLGLLLVALAIGLTARLAGLAWVLPILAGLVLAVLALGRRLGSLQLRGPGRVGQPARPAGIPDAIEADGIEGAGIEGGAVEAATVLTEAAAVASAAANAPGSRLIREFWAFSAPRAFGGVFQLLILYLDVLLVGAFLGARQAGAYAIASRFVVYGTFGLQAAGTAIAPQFGRLSATSSRRELARLYKAATTWVMLACWPPLLLLAVFAPTWLSVFGRGYRLAGSALLVLALAMLANTGTGPNGLLVLMAGRSKANLWLQAGGCILNVALDLWLIPRSGPFGAGAGLGVLGAAIAWGVTILVMAVAASLVLWKAFRIHPFGPGWGLATACAAGCYGVIGLVGRLWFGDGVAVLVVCAGAGSVIYGWLLVRYRNVLELAAFTGRRRRPRSSQRLDEAG